MLLLLPRTSKQNQHCEKMKEDNNDHSDGCLQQVVFFRSLLAFDFIFSLTLFTVDIA